MICVMYSVLTYVLHRYVWFFVKSDVFFFFFFKQKTAYEMRISDWSSDVCSSDLACKAGTDDQNSCLMSGHRYFSERQKVKSAQPVDGLRLANESLGMLRFRTIGRA